jgi:hypothetical protein
MSESGLYHHTKQLVWGKVSANLYLIGKLGMAIGLETKSPIFIVGTGRCGTDLLVEVLRSHPRLISFPGEANEFWHPKLYSVEEVTIEQPPIEVDPRRFTEVSVQSWPSHHADRIRQTFAGFHLIFGYGKLLVVKSAMVSFLIPKILEIFPGARFIHIYRSGPSVVKSYVKKNFGTYPKYVVDQEEYQLSCARYWNRCILEIERVKASLSLLEKNAYFELSYEDLCGNTEGCLNSLARYLGVEENGFHFDTSSIRNQNYKAGDYATDPRWAEPLRVMEPAMMLKGYI